jgi:hypothetical protein
MKFFSLVAADRGSTGSEYDNLELQGNQKGWSAEKGGADAAGKAIQLLLLIFSPASLPCGSSPHHYQHDAAAATRRHPVAPATSPTFYALLPHYKMAGTFCYLPCLYSNDVLANIQITRKCMDASLLAKHKERSVYQFISVS